MKKKKYEKIFAERVYVYFYQNKYYVLKIAEKIEYIPFLPITSGALMQILRKDFCGYEKNITIFLILIKM